MARQKPYDKYHTLPQRTPLQAMGISKGIATLEAWDKVLERASETKDPEAAELALKNGANPNFVATSGDNTLTNLISSSVFPEEFIQKGYYFITYNKPLETIGMFIRGGTDLGFRNKFDRTPLHFIAVHQKGEYAELLLKHGADPEAKDDQGFSPVALSHDLKRPNPKLEAAVAKNAEDLKTGKSAKAAEATGNTLEAIRLYCEAAKIHANRYASREPEADWKKSLDYTQKACDLHKVLIQSPTKTPDAIENANLYLSLLQAELLHINTQVYGFRITNCQARGEETKDLSDKQAEYQTKADAIRECTKAGEKTVNALRTEALASLAPQTSSWTERTPSSPRPIPAAATLKRDPSPIRIDSRREEHQPLLADGLRQRFDPPKRNSSSPTKA